MCEACPLEKSGRDANKFENRMKEAANWRSCALILHEPSNLHPDFRSMWSRISRVSHFFLKHACNLCTSITQVWYKELISVVQDRGQKGDRVSDPPFQPVCLKVSFFPSGSRFGHSPRSRFVFRLFGNVPSWFKLCSNSSRAIKFAPRFSKYFSLFEDRNMHVLHLRLGKT